MLIEMLAYGLLLGLCAAAVAAVAFWCWLVIDRSPALGWVAARREKSSGGG